MLDTLGFQNDMCAAFEQEVVANDVPAIQALQELVQNLPDTLVTDVMHDLDEFEVTGNISTRIEGVLKRAVCMIQADRIAAHI